MVLQEPIKNVILEGNQDAIANAKLKLVMYVLTNQVRLQLVLPFVGIISEQLAKSAIMEDDQVVQLVQLLIQDTLAREKQVFHQYVLEYVETQFEQLLKVVIMETRQDVPPNVSRILVIFAVRQSVQNHLALPHVETTLRQEVKNVIMETDLDAKAA